MPNDIKGAAHAANAHNLEVYDRARMVISGVNDVSEFADNIIKLKTVMGDMTVKGAGLSINRLDTDDGAVEVSGEIDLIQYSLKKKSGFLASLLK